MRNLVSHVSHIVSRFSNLTRYAFENCFDRASSRGVVSLPLNKEAEGSIHDKLTFVQEEELSTKTGQAQADTGRVKFPNVSQSSG